MYMKKFAILTAALICLCACNPYQNVTVTLPDGFSVKARVADTPEKKEKGLMFVKHLPENEGMLFLSDEDELQQFWMKNTLINLDIAFIKNDHTVSSVAHDMEHTYTYTPDYDVPQAVGFGRYVLELPAGTAAKHGVEPGAKIAFTLPEKK